MVIAEKSDMEGGFAAVDDLFFKDLPGACETLPPDVNI